MIRPFKDIKEFNTKIHKSIGSIIKLRYKANPKQTIIGMITSFGPDADAIGIGSCVRYLSSMPNVYEYFDENSAKWLPFGVEETKKPAKFKVGKQYTGTNSNNEQYSVVISAKYRDPKDNKVRVVVSNRFLEEIYTDKDDNERFSLVDDVIKAENEEGEIGF